jgi:hypothetical protein
MIVPWIVAGFAGSENVYVPAFENRCEAVPPAARAGLVGPPAIEMV